MSKDKMIEWLEVLHKQIEVPELTKNGRIMAVDILFHEVETALEELPEHGWWMTQDTVLGKCCICSVCGGCPNIEYRYCPYCGSFNGGKE